MPTLTFNVDRWAEMGEELPGGLLSNIKSGGDYVIIGENFLRAKAIARVLGQGGPDGPVYGEPLKVLVTMGGSDPNGLAERLTLALMEVDGLQVTVVIGPASTPSPGFRRIIDSPPDPFTFLSGVKDLAPYAARADLAFSAMGVTVYELAYMGVPSVLIANYPEDALDIEELELMGICRSLGYYRDVTEEDIRRATGPFIGNRGRLKVISNNARRLIDGRGAERIAEIISGLYKHDKSLGEPGRSGGPGAESATGKVRHA
jgi:spore coat polysaccharide biosynthesis predicted glycosyltransferase SpsG